ncbi:MAG: hypothetical protein LBK82_17325 [Planctomycetaceae bacterium]|nr:hypothetical protein [Planctomycetaceae bacterium]
MTPKRKAIQFAVVNPIHCRRVRRRDLLAKGHPPIARFVQRSRGDQKNCSIFCSEKNLQFYCRLDRDDLFFYDTFCCDNFPRFFFEL